MWGPRGSGPSWLFIDQYGACTGIRPSVAPNGWDATLGLRRSRVVSDAVGPVDGDGVAGSDHDGGHTGGVDPDCRAQDLGEHDNAVTTLQELLIDETRVLGPDHLHTLVTRNNLAILLGETGDTSGAVSALQELLTDQLRILGPDHPETLGTRLNLASWRGDAGDPACAVAAYQGLLNDLRRVHGHDHPATFAARANLAYWRGEGGDPIGAAAVWTTLITDYQRVLDPTIPKRSPLEAT